MTDSDKRTSVYIAASWHSASSAKALRTILAGLGIDCCSHWIDVALSGGARVPGTDAAQQAAGRVLAEIRGCDALVWLHTDVPTRGAFVEQGMALALGKPVYTISVCPDAYTPHVFVQGLPHCRDAADLAAALHEDAARKGATVLTPNESQSAFNIDAKRFYAPFTLRTRCPKCGIEHERDFSENYLMYPSIGAPNDVGMWCVEMYDDDDTDFEHDRDVWPAFDHAGLEFEVRESADPEQAAAELRRIGEQLAACIPEPDPAVPRSRSKCKGARRRARGWRR